MTRALLIRLSLISLVFFYIFSALADYDTVKVQDVLGHVVTTTTSGSHIGVDVNVISGGGGGGGGTTGTVAVSTMPPISGTVGISSGTVNIAGTPAVNIGSNGTVSVSGPISLTGGTIGASNIGTATLTNVRNVYSSTNVTTSAFVTLITSTASATNSIQIFDSSGQTLRLNYAASCGALAAGTNELYVIPGGNGLMPWTIPSGQCVGIEAISATANTGEIDITLFK